MTTISIITPTYERPDLLARAAESVLRQTVTATVEFIVVNDSPNPLPYAPWQDDPRVQVLATHGAERSVARNTGAAASTGAWLHFLDDDDYLLPGALAALLLTAQGTDAALVYGSYEVHSAREGTAHLVEPELAEDAFPAFLADEMLPVGPCWFRREAFTAAGGYDPALVQAEDVDMYRRMALQGRAAGTKTRVAVLRIEHPRTSLTHQRVNRARWRLGLEKCLNLPGVLAVALAQTQGSSYWRGRCGRKFLSSAVYNARRGRLKLALERLRGWRTLANGRAGQAAFWQGVRKQPQTRAGRGISASEVSHPVPTAPHEGQPLMETPGAE